MDMGILITGGAGFLGRAILSELRSEHDFTVFSRDEHKQWKLKEQYPEMRWVLGDVRDYARVGTALMDTTITGVIHAAAHKFVPEGETDASEFVATNTLGSYHVGMAAGLTGKRFAILISTDKAINPVSNYGATKMMAERVWRELSQRFPNTRYITVRYGNVIGSTGSVVELFRNAAESGGTIRVTDLSATRFWMTASEAVQVVRDAIHAGNTSASTGRIYIPNHALRAATMATLLDAMDITEHLEIGLRPGERMHESLIGEHERGNAIHIGPYIAITHNERLPHAVPMAASLRMSSDTVRQMDAAELRGILPVGDSRGSLLS